MNRMTDLDFENRNSWQSALNMLFSLCGEAADLSFTYLALGENKLPVLEIRLDNPAELVEPTVLSWGEGTMEVWKWGTVVLADKKPEKVPEGPVWLIRRSGAAAVIYRAFSEAVRVLRELGLPAEFSWSALPLAPVCDDLALTLRREAESYAYGAIHTIWLRCPDDEKLKYAMRAMGKCGQLRVQNMATANTWIAGVVDEGRLLDGLRNLDKPSC